MTFQNSSALQMATGHPMQKLSDKLDICAPALRGKTVYLDFPVHGNVGDLLIWLGGKRFLERNKIDITGSFSINNIGARAGRLLDECDTICFHGGGNLGDLWPHHQKLRERVIRQYARKRIVILPQSVHFSDEAALAQAAAIFKAHPDLHIFVRDKNSLGILQRQDIPRIGLCPDMAHALWGGFKAGPPMTTQPLYLFRRDHEARGLPSTIIPAGAASFDWDDLLTGMTRRIYDAGVRIMYMDGGKGRNHLPAFTVWGAAAAHLAQRSVDIFARHEEIITNRLHAVILATLLGRKSVSYDNFYGKVSSYIACWMSDISDIVEKEL